MNEKDSSVLGCFKLFLNMSDESLKIFIDLYNLGVLLSTNARLALEAIDALND